MMTATLCLLGLLLATAIVAAVAGDDENEGAGADGQNTGEDTDTDDPGETTGPPGGGDKPLTQADVDRAVQARLKREQAKAAKATAELQAELDRLKAAEAERANAELSEIDRATKTAAEAQAAVKAAEAAQAAAEQKALLATAIANDAADLPNIYRQLVSGDTDEAIAESITEARKQFDADRAGLAQRIATLTPEQIADEFGEPGKALAERLAGRPPSIGNQTNAGEQPGAPPPVKPLSGGSVRDWAEAARKARE